jgi:hypothetical protein
MPEGTWIFPRLAKGPRSVTHFNFEMNTGIEILNVSDGDTKISFDTNNPADIERARKIIPDMLKRGYALFVEVNGQLERVESFDPATSEYIVRMPWEAEWEGKLEKPAEELPASDAKGKKKERKVRLPMKTNKVTAIGRSAGG